MTTLEVCILAAGIGSRMKSSRPKAMQTLAGRPLLAHCLEAVDELSPDRVHVIHGPEGQLMQDTFSNRQINWVLQEDRRGTGHAVMQALDHFDADSRVLLLVGDAPLITAGTLQALINLPVDLGILSVDLDDPTGYGRIVRNDSGAVRAIIEQRDASPDIQEIREINTGIMVTDATLLAEWLPQLSDDNDQKEYLITDIIQMACDTGRRVDTSKSTNALEVTGVNTFTQLANLDRQYQFERAQQLMDEGVQIADPNRFDQRGNLTIGKDVYIDINVILEGDVVIGDNVRIGPNCVIKDTTIGAGSEIKANTVTDGAILEENCSAGPFARLRPGTYLCDQVAIGNFVEVKKSRLGKGTKASHLSYLGDSTLGEMVNIGAGTITCNYDGVNKWETHIGDGVFVGSNTSLVAPVTLGAGSTTGAGSTITKEVAPDVLAIGRGKQTIISNWQRPKKKS